MSTERNKAVIRQFVEEVINKKNMAFLNEIVVEDFIEDLPLPGQQPGREGLRYAVELFLKAFPDIVWTLDEQIAEGDMVVSRFTWTGTHQGAFLGVQPTGRRVAVWGVTIDVVKNGKFAQSRIIMDMLGLMQQLGLMK